LKSEQFDEPAKGMSCCSWLLKGLTWTVSEDKTSLTDDTVVTQRARER
jgi:hypothetical protein